MRSRSEWFCFGVAGLILLNLATVGVALGEEPVFRPIRLVAADDSDREARQPQVAVDAKGRIFVAFGVGNKIRCARSDDGGRTFAVSTVGEVDALALGMRRGPRVAVAADAVIVSAIGGHEGKGRDGDLLAWRSTDAGATWSPSTRINTVGASAREGLHAMSGSPDGSVFSAWLDLRAGRTEIYGSRSKDGGATWEPDRLVYRSPGGSVCECCHPSVAYGLDGVLCVMWRNHLQGARDLYWIRSTDGGDRFGSAEKLGQGTWPLTACPMDGGAISAGPNGQVETVWMREGAVFEVEPGQPERRLGRGVQPWSAIGPVGPVVVWLAGRPGRLLARLPGFSEPSALAEGAIDPVVAAGPQRRGPVVAVWESKGGGIFGAILDQPGPSPTR